VHVALHCWREKLNQKSDNIALNLYSEFQNITHTLLLHVAIKLISDQTPGFWKACMVASNCKLDNHKWTFSYLINIINEESNFMEAFKWVKLVVERREEELVECMRWLRNVYDDIDYDDMLGTLEKYVVVACCDKIEEAMVEFSVFKSRFCESDVYEDARARFGLLLEKYRKARRQCIKGMLSLNRKY
jgi:bifunctional lysine-specific demethylase and histidyl-hydroxylase MINA